MYFIILISHIIELWSLNQFYCTLLGMSGSNYLVNSGLKKFFLCDNWQVCIYHIFNFFYVKGFVFWMSKIIIKRFFFESFTIITLLINGLLNISVLHGCSDHIDCRTTVKFFFYLLLAYVCDLTYLYVHLNFCIYRYIYIYI